MRNLNECMGPFAKMPALSGALALIAVSGASSFVWATGDGGAGGDALAPAKMTAGPSLLETGKVGPAKLEGEGTTKEIRPAPKLKARPEPKVAAPAPAPAPAAAPTPKVTLPRAVQQQVTARLRELDECRAKVARDKHVSAGQVRAGSVLLRWTIGLDGTVTGTEVVEQTPVDPAVLECARQTITKWTFPVPDNGPLPIERRYRFHAAK